VTLALDVAIEPARLDAEPANVTVRLVLRNAGSSNVTIHPSVAQPSGISSYAGIGITWVMSFYAGGERQPMQELRRWYGPPGNPPGPGALTHAGVTLAPTATHETLFAAVWIPNARLEARHLAPAAIDPQGMDNIAAPSRIAGHPALAERIDLPRASVLVFGATWEKLSPEMAKDDFLRGHLVAFMSAGEYTLRASYIEAPFFGGTKVHSNEGAASLRVG
jgi:hypothetical protein